jgi:hypothetical protein
MRTERTIRKCPVRMKLVCPRTWQGLQPTADSNVRHCAQCDQDVYFCRTDQETLRHARAGHCIAREEPAEGECGEAVLGIPEESSLPTPEQELANQWRLREQGISEVLNHGPFEGERDCPRCAYPVPGFRKTCYVCGFELGRG